MVDINYKLETYRSLSRQRKEIDEKYRELAQNLTSCETNASSDFLKKFPEKRPQFSYPHNVSLQDRAVSNNYCYLLYTYRDNMMQQFVVIVSNRF